MTAVHQVATKWQNGRGTCWERHCRPGAEVERPVQICSIGDRLSGAVLRFPHVAQRSIQVGPKVLDGLDAHAQPQQRWRQVLLPRNASPPFDGRLDRSQAGVRAHRAHSSQSRGFIRRCGRIDAPARQPAEPEVHQRQPARQGDRGALAAQKMIEPDVSMLAYMPCRIGIPEDGQGGTWIVAMLIDEAVIQALPAAARESAQYVTGTMQEIVVATARRDL